MKVTNVLDAPVVVIDSFSEQNNLFVQQVRVVENSLVQHPSDDDSLLPEDPPMIHDSKDY